ncbi:MAG: gamma-glutamyltransferase, partial [Bacteroidota bacterium]
QDGGNAFDAAVAVQFALAVVYPGAGNIGGGGFMVAQDAEGKRYALDFREKAPAAAERDMYLDPKGEVVADLSWRGALAAGVPGSVAGMFALHDSLGSLPMADLIDPSILLAAGGFTLTEKEAKKLNSRIEDIRQYSTLPNALVKRDSVVGGDSLLLPMLAATLNRIKEDGQAGFYGGKTADLIVEEMQRGGGIITHEDLLDYDAVWRQPLVGNYKGYSIISMPPPSSGGIALLQLLESVEPYPLEEYGPLSPEAIHLMVEAERRTYADRAAHLGDMDYYPVPLAGLIDTAYIRERMADFDPAGAGSSEVVVAGVPAPESEETTHFSIIDAAGNAVSITTTLNGTYGACAVVGGAGFLLNNEMDDFSSKPGVPNKYGLVGGEANAIAAGKRMLSSMTPTIVTRGNDVRMVLGTPGGSTIITSVFQNIINVLEFGLNMQASVELPRFHHQWLPDLIQYEEQALPAKTEKSLEKLGHSLKVRSSIGRVDAILVRPDGTLEAGADPRGDDTAAGY